MVYLQVSLLGAVVTKDGVDRCENFSCFGVCYADVPPDQNLLCKNVTEASKLPLARVRVAQRRSRGEISACSPSDRSRWVSVFDPSHQGRIDILPGCK